MQRSLRGGTFENRYRICGTLTTISPLHIGSGEETADDPHAASDAHTITRIIKDSSGKPLIPGSALKGVMRHWLLNVLSGLGLGWAATHVYSDDALTAMDQTARANHVLQEFSWLELLFGTPFHAGKIDVWDSRCLTADIASRDSLSGWKAASLTYIDTSVAIDPEKGTAAEHLLYDAEAVPPGVQFEVSVCGQNLSDLEVGMILLALQGFNSRIYPLTLGARTGRGYGRMRFAPDRIFRLLASDLPTWIEATIGSYGSGRAAEAGYYALPELSRDQQEALIRAAKQQFVSSKEVGRV